MNEVGAPWVRMEFEKNASVGEVVVILESILAIPAGVSSLKGGWRVG